MNEPLRVSYSILSAWARGNYDDAIDMYTWADRAASQAMLDGRDWHKRWEAETRRTSCLPELFGGTPLVDPKVEVKIERLVTPWLLIVGKLDLMHRNVNVLTGIDYKTGTTPSNGYTSGFQHSFYQALAPRMKRFEYHCYNQYTKEVTMSIVHLTPLTLKSGLEYILTYGSEFKCYVEENGLVAGGARKA